MSMLKFCMDNWYNDKSANKHTSLNSKLRLKGPISKARWWFLSVDYISKFKIEIVESANQHQYIWIPFKKPVTHPSEHVPGPGNLIIFQSVKVQACKILKFHSVLGELEVPHMPLYQLDPRKIHRLLLILLVHIFPSFPKTSRNHQYHFGSDEEPEQEIQTINR